MLDNGESDNVYDPSSFRSLLKTLKECPGQFNIGVLPEGQLNPTPENGMLKIHTGGKAIARILNAEIVAMGLKGTGKIWCPRRGIVGVGREVEVKVFGGREFEEGVKEIEAWTLE
ncbi:hypothetical protein TrVE_jg2092 [Triparma verrucosa]|uniref:Uncharacterized protein n=2 Tax=Triparma TaxID=722752 RepID=A0A9W7ECD4_9STRA|nr:hypothetical protein TrST_g13787 [Triparma strigata]GMI08888.1 hypothetical protein TrVE_jg2092 [Triparma verrucosa]